MPVINDEQLVASADPERYFWLSGGGTFVLEGRFAIVVERSAHSRINAGKLSLFTGRANDEAEWAEPRLLLRELFEELIVVDAAGQVRLPSFASGWVDARGISRGAWERTGRRVLPSEDVVLEPIALAGSPLSITQGGETRVHEVLLHVNQLRDINVLYALSCDLALDAFWALDGEADDAYPRRIFALDIVTLVAINVTFGSQRDQIQVGDDQLTEHCSSLVRNLRQRIQDRVASNHR